MNNYYVMGRRGGEAARELGNTEDYDVAHCN